MLVIIGFFCGFKSATGLLKKEDLPLECCDKLGLREHMAGYCLVDCISVRCRKSKIALKRIEAENIAVCRADWRAWGIVPPESCTALTLLGFVCQHLGIGLASSKFTRIWRYIVDKPMREDTLGSIGIFQYEDETFSTWRNGTPRYFRGFTYPLAGKYFRKSRPGAQ